MSRVLAIATHPDDETLGCGGTLLKHKDHGDELYWLIVTRACEPRYPAEVVQRQIEQVQAVAGAYQFCRTEWLKFETSRLDVLPRADLIDALWGAIQSVRPEVVYMPSPYDAHSDHRIVFEAVTAVLKSFHQTSLGVRRILACEVPSETDAGPAAATGSFVPHVYSDISGTFDRKLDIMRLFASELQPEPMPRSASAITALARMRGAAIGVVYAEAFMLIRELM